MTVAEALSDAITAIEDYQREGRRTDLTEEIEAVLAPMRVLREHLDCPLSHEHAGARRAALRCC